MLRAINHVSIPPQKAPDTLIISYSCVFSHNNLALSCKDSPACDLCVRVRGRGRENGERERRKASRNAATVADAAATVAAVVACFSLPAIFHPGVYVISVHFLLLFPPTVSAGAGVHILLFINAGRRLEEDGSGTKSVFWSVFFFFSYQRATVYCAVEDNEIHTGDDKKEIALVECKFAILAKLFSRNF